MRKGKNPAKLDSNNKVESKAFHQVIVPVYLPELKGFYQEGLDILKLCLESIYLTTHKETFISVVNNGSCAEVKAYLDQCLENKKIHEVIHTSAIGKISAIAKGVSGHNFDLVTITDADVMFMNGWQKAVYEIYNSFPKAGFVGTTPNSKMLKHFTENVHFSNLFNENFKFRRVKDKEDMLAFAKSIGKEYMFNEIHSNYILTLKKNKTIATVGTGHFTGTYKSYLLHHLKKSYSDEKISAYGDREYLDKPSVKNGEWRLCTYRNFSFHLGNKVEDWMVIKLKLLKPSKVPFNKKPSIKFSKEKFLMKSKQYIFRKLFFNKYVIPYYYRWLGLSPKEAYLYIQNGKKH